MSYLVCVDILFACVWLSNTFSDNILEGNFETKYLPYKWKFSRYEIFAEQEANRIFPIIFSRITGPLWKGSMLCTVINL